MKTGNLVTTPSVQPPTPQNPYAQPVPNNPYAQPAVPPAPQAAYPQQAPYPQQGAPHPGVPQQGIPQQGVPHQGIPQQGAPHQGVPQQGAPQQPWGAGQAQQQPVPPMGHGPAQGPVCRFCGSVPAVDVTIRGHRGMIFVMQFLKLRGPFCRRCGIAMHRDMTSKSLWQGWWGIASMAINPITMLINLGARAQINRLAEPIPGAPGRPMDPGKPIFARPAALLLLLPVAAFCLFVTVAVVGSQSDPDFASVGDCVYNAGTANNPDVIVTDCSSPKAAYTIVGKFDDTTDDTRCKEYPTSEVAYTKEYDSTEYVLCLAPNS